ncbi:MAG TPA: hypothetical protein VFU08_03790, partial [Candidatus Udaeobacter sp.]|nr:hypothetical protein [Candidatus Udaeobacter sp.]
MTKVAIRRGKWIGSAALANKRGASAVKLRLKSAYMFWKQMRPEIATIENSARSCSLSAIPVSLTLPIDGTLPTENAFTNRGAARSDYDVMTR